MPEPFAAADAHSTRAGAVALDGAAHARGKARYRERVSVPRGFVLRRLLVAADTLAITAALFLSLSLFGTRRHSLGEVLAGLAVLPGWILLFKMYGLYDRDS